MTKKLALLIGINYKGTSAELNGCINDVNKMKHFLLNKCGYQEENIKILTDDTEIKPTAYNILNELGKIIVEAYYLRCNEIFLHYSGHGTYVTDYGNDEDDNKDEALVPLDYQENGLILDDLIHDYFAYLPKSVKCVCLFDCCHSGTMMDLPYRYKNAEKYEIENKNSNILANVIMLSGCRDSQTSADAYIKGNWAGAMTDAFLNCLEQFNYNLTYFHLLNTMRSHLRKNKYEQIPQICTSKKVLNTDIFMSHKVSEPFLKTIL